MILHLHSTVPCIPIQKFFWITKHITDFSLWDVCHAKRTTQLNFLQLFGLWHRISLKLWKSQNSWTSWSQRQTFQILVNVWDFCTLSVHIDLMATAQKYLCHTTTEYAWQVFIVHLAKYALWASWAAHRIPKLFMLPCLVCHRSLTLVSGLYSVFVPGWFGHYFLEINFCVLTMMKRACLFVAIPIGLHLTI